MAYDLEYADPVEEMLDNLIETSDKVRVSTSQEAVQIQLGTDSGQFLVKRFIVDNRVELEVL